jgi:hypothetical protein
LHQNEEQLIRIELEKLHPHPKNPNSMTEEQLDKLARNIASGGRYPPLIARPHPNLVDEFELLAGHQRQEVLRRLGYRDALCLVWACDDVTALTLLATLNGRHGEEVPSRQADLLRELMKMAPQQHLSSLLPDGYAPLIKTLTASVDQPALITKLRAGISRASGAPDARDHIHRSRGEPRVGRGGDQACMLRVR